MSQPTTKQARMLPTWCGVLGIVTLLALGGGHSPRVNAEDAPADPAPAASEPKVHIESPRGGQTRERVVTIQGTVEGIRASTCTLVLNGVPLTIKLNDTKFSTQQVLAPGWNAIRVSARGASKGGALASAEDDVAVFAQVPRKDLRITLTWDTPGTDVDMWVTGPDGEKISYQHKQGAAGGILDTDVTDGFGPETYTQARIQQGRYRVQLHAYNINRPTRVEVVVIQGEGTPTERRRRFDGVLMATGEILEVAEFDIDGP